MKTTTRMITCLVTALVTANAGTSHAAFTPIWFDGFDVSAGTSDINFEIGPPRQGGPLVPTTYVANTANPANDYHHQLFGGGNTPLQLAGDFNLPAAGGPVLVSPTQNFVGFAGGEVIGKKIDLVIDAYTNADPTNTQPTNTTFTYAAVTVGSSSTLANSNTKADGFSVVFVEDKFGGNGNFIQLFDGSSLVGNLIPNPAGAGAGFVELLIEDPTDGNPWDGIGQTTVDVLVNSTPVGSYTRTGGGYTNNFITLEGMPQTNFAFNSLATHVFDNLTVFTAPVPEPTSIGLCAATLLGGWGVCRRRWR